MGWALKFTRWLAVSAITLTVAAFILDATILNPKYVTAAAGSSGFYQAVADFLPGMLAGGLPEQQQKDAKFALSTAITPEYVGRQWQGLAAGWDAHYRQSKPLPKLPFPDIKARVAQKGLSLPPELSQQLDRPPALQDFPALGLLYALVHWAKLLGIPLALALLWLVWYLSGGRLSAIGRTLVGAVVGLGVYFVVLAASPGLLAGALSGNADTKPLAKPITQFLQAVFAGANQKLLLAIAILAGLAVVCFVLNFVFKLASGRGGGGGAIRPIQKFHPPDK